MKNRVHVLTYLLLFFYHAELLYQLPDYSYILGENIFLLGALISSFLLAIALSIFASSRIFPVVSLLLAIPLYKLLNPIGLGQDVLAFNLLIFGALLPGGEKNSDHIAAGGILFLLGELLVIYTSTGLSKLNSPFWRDGALGTILSEVNGVASFPSFFLQGIPGMFLCWSVILLQLSIILILFKKPRKYVALAFMLMHLVIAFTVEFYFGLLGIMMHLYVFQYEGSVRNEWKKICECFIREGSHTHDSLL